MTPTNITRSTYIQHESIKNPDIFFIFFMLGINDELPYMSKHYFATTNKVYRDRWNISAKVVFNYFIVIKRAKILSKLHFLPYFVHSDIYVRAHIFHWLF